MKIGVLAYHAAYNFGANLQIFSTVGYLRKNGYEPIVINWIAEDLEEKYRSSIPEIQAEVHKEFLNKHFETTAICRTASDIAKIIEKEKIEAVIIGSDAVAQNHPLWSRIIFPTKRIFEIRKYTSDRYFPNPFWGTFTPYLSTPVPITFLSASSQNSDYKSMSRKAKSEMSEALSRYKYISVRDKWTQGMFKNVTRGKINPDITPDPVFAFNYNITEEQIPKEEILNKFGLPENYILLSFKDSLTVSTEWISQFEQKAASKGYTCVALPFPGGILFKNPLSKVINIPLSPLEWYALIKYSSGYVGHNMHPIIVSLHNSVPFFCFDHYGIVKLRCFVNRKSSKIYDILDRAGFLENMVSVHSGYKRPSPDLIFRKIEKFDKDKCAVFARNYYSIYEKMMDDLILALKNIN